MYIGLFQPTHYITKQKPELIEFLTVNAAYTNKYGGINKQTKNNKNTPHQNPVKHQKK